MPEIGPSHPATYRQEITTPIFARIKAGGSCAVAGAASMGKSRLLRHILRPEIRRHFLGEQADTTLLIWVDCNRLAEFSPWGLYELMLTSIFEGLPKDMRAPYEAMRDLALTSGDSLLAQRKLEGAVRVLCSEEGLRLFFILDEFDHAYMSIDERCFANLRALRDMNKYAVGFILFMRDEPNILRDPEDIEGFYELFSRNVFGLTPYIADDSQNVIEQITERRRHELGELPANYEQEITSLSGGHPGLIVALMDRLATSKPTGKTWFKWATGVPNIVEECRKVWEGLRPQEQRTLSYLAQGISTPAKERKSLILKGLIRDHGKDNITIFSPLFLGFLRSNAVLPEDGLLVDLAAGNVLINGQPTLESLTSQEFKLISYLYDNSNEIRSVDEIIEFLYPGEAAFNVTNNSVAALVGRIRRKIEPNYKKPRYLINMKGLGYKLIDQPE